jgi:hypothetical protein
MVFAFAPIVGLLLGLSSIAVTWATLFLSLAPTPLQFVGRVARRPPPRRSWRIELRFTLQRQGGCW